MRVEVYGKPVKEEGKHYSLNLRSNKLCKYFCSWAYSSYDVDAGHLFKLLGWKNLACQQQFQRATMVYRSLHGLAPNYLSSKFERREVAYNLRDSENKLNVPFPRTNYYKNSFSYSGAILWNSLPCNLREAESLGQFKRLLKEL